MGVSEIFIILCAWQILFHSPQCKDSKRVFECLKKAGRIANQCMEEGVKAQLLVELLSIYMHFYEKGNDQASVGQRP